MANLSTVAAPILTITLGGLELKVGRITLKVMAEFERWCQEQIYTRARKGLIGLPADLQASVMKMAVEESNRCTIGTEVGQAASNSIEGTAMIVYLASKDTTPGLTHEDILSHLTMGDQVLLGDLVKKASGISTNVSQEGIRNPT